MVMWEFPHILCVIVIVVLEILTILKGQKITVACHIAQVPENC